MNSSFYTAALGAQGQQTRLDVIGNNLANVNTTAYKSKNATFADLMHSNIRGIEGGAQNQTRGTGIRLAQVDTDLTTASFEFTGSPYDFAIEGEGFFMLSDPVTGAITYTRDGHFQLSDGGDEEFFYLVSSSGKRVLDQEGNPMTVEKVVYENLDEDEDNADYADDEDEEVDEGPRVAVYRFPVKNGMQSAGENEFVPDARNGQPILMENVYPIRGATETSNVDFATEMARMVEAQKAYSYALKMVQTSDEIESTINGLRA